MLGDAAMLLTESLFVLTSIGCTGVLSIFGQITVESQHFKMVQLHAIDGYINLFIN